ncbi:MAG: DUF58 domain-containing protein [Leptolyngbyaceae cyanobacterium]
MKLKQTHLKLADWLETHWVAPAYSGWLLGSLSVFFFLAATNTMAGWLYVMSGISFALLLIAAWLSERMLHDLIILRQPIAPVSAGDALTFELVIQNRGHQSKTLLQIWDQLPSTLGKPAVLTIESIAPHGQYHWVYYQLALQRGVYRWRTVDIRTGAPLGLFWCRRSQTASAVAVVYPTVLPLVACPLVDDLGRDTSFQVLSDRRTQAATEGLTRSLRPYRWGDPTRLIHWRTSARYRELRVRELEIFTGGQEVIICLDSGLNWRTTAETDTAQPQEFEQAVIAAASLYFYACHQSLQVKLWTAGTGLIHGHQVVLQALAAIQSQEPIHATDLPTLPLVWLTQNSDSLRALPTGSRWLLWLGDRAPAQWQAQARGALSDCNCPGIVINSQETLQTQLQKPLTQF